MWGDEVHALLRALARPNLAAMWRSLRIETHPALWYLLVRGAHTLVPRPQILQILALAIASACALLLLFRSPFSWWMKLLLLSGNAFLFEYSVMARNYGIAMLVMFLIAIAWRADRVRPPLVGILLLLLANCNAPSVILTGGFLLWGLMEARAIQPDARGPALRRYGWNAAIAILGIAICGATIFPAELLPGAVPVISPDAPPGQPPVTGLASVLSRAKSAADLVKGLLLPGAQFQELAPTFRPLPADSATLAKPLPALLLSLVLMGSTLGLLPYPGAFFAAATTLTGFSLFFALSFRGSYRHEALWLTFLVACYWITRGKKPVWQPASVRWRRFRDRATLAGRVLFILLIAMQVPIGVVDAAAATAGKVPFSCSGDLGAWVHTRPDLRDATVTAEPDDLVTALPYYASNPTYLMREHRFGAMVADKGWRLGWTLGDVLDTARYLRGRTGQPVIVLMSQRLLPAAPPQTYRENREWRFETTPDQVRAFLAATEMVRSCPAAISGEHYDVYLLQ